MHVTSWQVISGVVLWAALVGAIDVATPGHDLRRLGVAALARGPLRRFTQLTYLLLGMVAAALVAMLLTQVPASAQSTAGLILFTVWGGGTALLAGYDTDLPGEPPTLHGRVHALVAASASACGVAGMLLVTWGLRGEPATAGLARWALPIALAAAVALLAQVAVRGSAGILQRLFLALVALWIIVVAAGV